VTDPVLKSRKMIGPIISTIARAGAYLGKEVFTSKVLDALMRDALVIGATSALLYQFDDDGSTNGKEAVDANRALFGDLFLLLAGDIPKEKATTVIRILMKRLDKIEDQRTMNKTMGALLCVLCSQLPATWKSLSRSGRKAVSRLMKKELEPTGIAINEEDMRASSSEEQETVSLLLKIGVRLVHLLEMIDSNSGQALPKDKEAEEDEAGYWGWFATEADALNSYQQVLQYCVERMNSSVYMLGARDGDYYSDDESRVNAVIKILSNIDSDHTAGNTFIERIAETCDKEDHSYSGTSSNKAALLNNQSVSMFLVNTCVRYLKNDNIW
jgi:hypothetical protein